MDVSPGSKSAVRSFDPKKNGKFKVRIGDIHTSKTGKIIKSVAFNHKPSQTGSKRKTTITPAQRDGHNYELRIEDTAGDKSMNYAYTGRKTTPDHAYILTFDHDHQAVQLDSLSSVYGFNMISAPWENDPEKLRQQYNQIEPQPAHISSSDKQSSGSEAEDFAAESDGPDDNNPFDYRHYLQGLPGAQAESKVPSMVSTPLLAPRVGSLSPRPPPRLNGSSPAVKPRPAVKKQPRPEPAKRQTKVFKSAEKIVDSDASDDNDGLLIIDNGPAPAVNRRRPPNLGGKSRSLHAAAEAARSSHQNPQAEQDAGSGYEEEDESDEPKEAPVPNDTTAAPNTVNKAHFDDEIEDLKLPGPIKPRPPQLIRRQSMWESGDEEELEAALAADDDSEDKPPAPNPSRKNAQESDSESEEE